MTSAVSSPGAEERAVAFLQDLPNLHERGNRPAHSGGLNLRLGRVMIDELSKLSSPSIIETGAGSSSLLFLMPGSSSVTSIAPDAKLGLRIREEPFIMANTTGVALG